MNYMRTPVIAGDQLQAPSQILKKWIIANTIHSMVKGGEEKDIFSACIARIAH